MKEMKIKKRSGGYRTIVVPSRQRKRACRALIPALQEAVQQTCHPQVVHGFAELRSPVTNAAQHVGYRYTLTFDLADFFDSVTEKRHGPDVAAIMHPADLDLAWHQGRAAQGLPTSPIVATLAANGMDRAILLLYRHPGPPFVYTRYADDLTFSFNDPALIEVLQRAVPPIVEQHGFAVNPKKTRLQCASAGRRIITGVAVDDTGIYPTRAAKRKLRAARHNVQTGQVSQFPRRQWTCYLKCCARAGRSPLPKQAWLARWLAQKVRGLEEWCALKFPQGGHRSTERIVTLAEHPADALTRLANREQWRLPHNGHTNTNR